MSVYGRFAGEGAIRTAHPLIAVVPDDETKRRRSGVCFLRAERGNTAMISIVMPCYNVLHAFAGQCGVVQREYRTPGRESTFAVKQLDGCERLETGALALDGLAQNDARIGAIHSGERRRIGRARRSRAWRRRGANGWPLWTQVGRLCRPVALPETLLALDDGAADILVRRICRWAAGRGRTRRSVGLRRRRPGRRCWRASVRHRQHGSIPCAPNFIALQKIGKKGQYPARRPARRLGVRSRSV